MKYIIRDNQLSWWMSDHSWSKPDLAERLGCSAAEIESYLDGQRVPPRQRLALLQLMGLPADELFVLIINSEPTPEMLLLARAGELVSRLCYEPILVNRGDGKTAELAGADQCQACKAEHFQPHKLDCGVIQLLEDIEGSSFITL